MKTVLMLADQMIGRIEYVHVKNFIHRDIKVRLLQKTSFSDSSAKKKKKWYDVTDSVYFFKHET